MEISTSSGGVVGVSGGLMSFLAANGRTGWRNIGFMVSTPRGAESLAAVRVTEADGGLRLRGSYMRAGLREEVALSPAAACALVITRRLTNAGNTSVTLHAAWAGRLPGGDGRPVFADNSVWRARN